MSAEIKNAVIQSTMLGIEDHGILTFYLTLDYGGSCQGAGGYACDWGEDGARKANGFMAIAVRRVLETVGVRRWEDLKGKHVRVTASYDKVHSLGHIIEDKWVDLQEVSKGVDAGGAA